MFRYYLIDCANIVNIEDACPPALTGRPAGSRWRGGSFDGLLVALVDAAWIVIQLLSGGAKAGEGRGKSGARHDRPSRGLQAAG